MEDAEKVVTMVDVLQQQQEFEEDADAVLGACDDKNCTYTKGYVKRQALYACLTCCSEAKTDPAKRAAVCLACSLNCHENHNLVELYTKRNFRCDCGNKKFNSPCQLTLEKDDINEDNIYNQNFVGLYCVCSRPYPDPDVPEEEEEDMIQCIICEDWLHASHLEANVPSNEQYAEMICQNCMDKNEFIYDYTNYAVNAFDCSMVDVTTIENITTVNGNYSNGDKISTDNENMDHQMDTNQIGFKEIKEPNINGTQTENIGLANHIHGKDSDNMAPFDSAEKVELSDKKINDNDERVEAEESKIKTDVKDGNKDSTVNEIERENMDKLINGIEDNQTESISNDSETSNKVSDENVDKSNNEVLVNDKDAETSVNNENSAIENIDNDQSSIPSIDNEENNANVETSNSEINKIDENIAESISNDSAEKLEQSLNKVLSSEDIAQSKIPEDRDADSNMESLDKKAEVNNENINETEIIHDNDQCAKTYAVHGNSAIKSGEVIEEKSDNNDYTAEVSDDSVITTNQNINLNTDAYTDKDVDKSDKTDEVNISTNNKDEFNAIETVSDPINVVPVEIEMNGSKQQNDVSGKIDNISSNENKRKLFEDDTVENAKKVKIDFGNCQRPREGAVRSRGATFWPSNFRQKLCTCSKCIEMYKDLSVLFLTDLEDTVTAYEAMGKEKSNGVSVSQYEKGLQALSSLDRVQQINALTEYNNMRDKLVDFLKNFKDRKEVVKEEDIKEFFAGMKARREPDGVYFCR